MNAFGYPKATEHKQYHKDFKYKVTKYYDEIYRSNPPDLSEITEFLKEWWVNHISHIDADSENYKKKTQATTTYSEFF